MFRKFFWIVVACLASVSTIACEIDVKSRIKNTRIVNGEITRQTIELFIPAATVSNAPRWIPGVNKLPLAPDEAVTHLLNWLSENGHSKDAEISQVRFGRCMNDAGFRMFVFDISGHPGAAVLFDGTVVPKKVIEE